MDLKEMSWEGLNGPKLADFILHWRTLFIMVMERRVR
jgi:hypothetical protein